VVFTAVREDELNKQHQTGHASQVSQTL
jgi:hypothetical protein